MNQGNDEPCYVISIASKMLGVQTHTLRYYEKIGVVQPYRSLGNIRLYSENDIVRLRRVKNLMDELGVNLAGVEVVLRMSESIAELQRRIKELESELQSLKGA